jgi:RHS repeat-associated protein
MNKNILRCGAATIALAMLAPVPAAAQQSASPYTSAQRLDAMGRVTGTISADPDGAGPLPHRATRNTYDGAGRLTRQETGTLAAWQSEAVAPAGWSGFTVHQVIDHAYDALDRKTRETVSAGGTAYSVTQQSYDAIGRPECSATRMNPGVFGFLPASACSLSSVGTFGPDRITRSVHDAGGQLTQVQVAVGTADQATEATNSYNLDGQLAVLTDGNGNRAEMRYDGHGRQDRWVFPSPTMPGAVNEADYESYGYDPNGNRTSRRARDGQVISSSYDALNRATLKNLPGSEPDVSYGYDLLGRMTSAATALQTLTFWYDALGRQLGESGPLGTVRSTYDAAGRRTMLIHPDRSIANYSFLDTGEMASIDVSIGLYGTNERLITFGYDGLGRRTSLERTNGAGTSYGYDAVGRLASLSHDMAGTARDVTFGYGYNPADQIVSRTVSNDVYATAVTNANQSDSHNGLNQISTTAGTPISHDAKGNTTSDPFVSMSYGYSSENLLINANGPYGNGTLTYDPIMRLWDSGTGGRTRVLHDGTQRIAEYSQAGGQRNRFVFGPGIDEPLIEYSGAGLANRQFLHGDERGSIIGTSDNAANSTGVGSFDDYGRILSFAGYRFGYAGQPYETVSELQYSRARFYNPRIGRFVQTDPVGYGGGINLYAYAGGDPVNFSDPTGEQPQVAVPLGICLKISWCREGLRQMGQGVARAVGRAAGRQSAPNVQPYLDGVRGALDALLSENNRERRPKEPASVRRERQRGEESGRRAQRTGGEPDGEGAPGNNQAQNRQFDSAVKELGLSEEQADLLHREVTGQDMSRRQIMERAREMFPVGRAK